MRLVQQGPRDARIALVGEAPGATEDSTGIPFCGGAGQVLDSMLSRVGISRSMCFITNVVHVRPPGNEFSYFLRPQPRPEFVLGLVQLKKDLEEIQPNVVIALGAQPLRMLTGKQSIDKWRGSILESTLCPGLKVIGTYHPAYVLRVWSAKAVAEFDLRRAASEADTKQIIRPERNLVLNPDRGESLYWLSRLLDADWLAVDIECFATEMGWKLACVGFSDRADCAVVWPCDEEWQRAIVKQLVESPVRKVFQNGMFDVTVLRSEGMNVQNYAWDTMYGHHALYAEAAGDEISAMAGKKSQAVMKKGLAFQVSIYTNEPFYKDDGKLWRETGDLQMFWRYNALDAACTREIRDVQEREIEDFGVRQVFDHEMALVEPLMTMMHRGVKINMDLRASLRQDFEQQIARLQSFLDAGAGESVNVKSNKQMVRLLYEKMNLPKKYHRESGNLTAGKDAINDLAGKFSHPLLQTVLEIRQRRDFIERYLEAKVDSDGRMRCSYDPSGTRSGRLSSRQSIYGSGTNLQNIPSRKPEGEAIRRCFIADEGKVIIGRDYSQAEARVVAHLANCHGLIELFDDPSRDIHKENASRIFNKSISEITDDERYLAKRVVHASNYGMEDDKLVIVVNEDAKLTGIRIDRKTARMLIDRYFMLYPEIKEVYWKGVERELKHSRTLNTPFGRKRVFYGRWDDKLLREAYSYIPQSTVGDLGCKALVNCYHMIEKEVDGAELLLQVHDAIYMQCWERDVELVAQMMRQAMDIPFEMNGRMVFIPTDCKVGRNWGSRPKKHPEQNPDGMVDARVWLSEHATIPA